MKKLTRREKILIGVSIVGIGVVGYESYSREINMGFNEKIKIFIRKGR